MEIFGVSLPGLLSQLLLGLVNGSFYAILSLGLAVIFGLLNVINFAHGALYMMGAFCAYFLLSLTGIGYWWALLIAPIAGPMVAWMPTRRRGISAFVWIGTLGMRTC